MVIEPHMKQGRQHKLISTIFLATSVTKKLDHNSWNIFGGNGKVMSERNRELQEVGFQTLKQNEKKQTNRTSEEAISDR